MRMILNGNELVLSDQVLSGYENYHIPGMVVCSSVWEEGVVITQQVAIGSTRLMYILIQGNDMSELDIFTDEVFSGLLMSLAGNWIVPESPHSVIIREGHLNVISVSELGIRCHISKNELFKLVLIKYDTYQSFQKILTYSHLNKKALLFLKHQQFFLFDESPLASATMVDIISHLIQTSYYPAPLGTHVEMTNRLFDAILELEVIQNGSVRYTTTETESIHAAKLLIDNNLDHYYSINEIAQHVGLNTQKLRIGFKELFKKGLYAYLLEQRLLRAKAQLEMSDRTIKEIAKTAGYHNVSNFCLAFKRKFGVTPKGARVK